MSDRDRRELRQGASDAFSTSFELIATPLIFGLLGWYLDGRFGLFPVLTLTLAVVALSYGVWQHYTNYVVSMDDLLDERRTHYSDGIANG